MIFTIEKYKKAFIKYIGQIEHFEVILKAFDLLSEEDVEQLDSGQKLSSERLFELKEEAERVGLKGPGLDKFFNDFYEEQLEIESFQTGNAKLK